MKSDFIIDWLSFTIKSDANNIKCKSPCLDFVFKFLNLDGNDFSFIGGGNRYKERYTCNNITVSVASDERFADMGIHISMSGQGLRYYEQVQKDGEFIKNGDLWREFFTRLRDLNADGYAVKPSRIDIAKDDFDGVINLVDIERCARQGEFVSRFKTAHKITVSEGLTDKDNGFTVTFGSRQSNTFLRFYDKKAEQIGKCQDEKRLRELEALKCWNRMEFEFKDINAIKIINMICDAESFGESFSEVVNGYIRFIDLDCDSNKSLCTMKKWWANFIGTIKKARLTVSDFISYSVEKTKKYFDKCLATTVYTVFQTNGLDDIMLSLQAAENKLKHKHIDIINGKRFDGGVSCYEQLWEALRSVPVSERSEYCY